MNKQKTAKQQLEEILREYKEDVELLNVGKVAYVEFKNGRTYTELTPDRELGEQLARDYTRFTIERFKHYRYLGDNHWISARENLYKSMGK